MERAMTENGQYVPCATYFHDSDCVEYVKHDSFTIYNRVDEFLTLIYDSTGLQLIGFKLKGFKNIFLKQLKPIYRLNHEQFLSLVSAIEAVCKEIGDSLADDEDRAQSYRAAANMAANDNVNLSGQNIRKIAA